MRERVVLLFEEPETHLHPHLRRKLRDVLERLAKNSWTVITATHSPEFISFAQSQKIVRLWRTGDDVHKGLRQCNGNYEMQTNQANGQTAECVLSAKDIRYWDVIPSVLTFDNSNDYRPCPFAGSMYQWMRNLVTCAAVAKHRQLKGAVLAIYADGPGLPMANEVQSGKWDELLARVKHDHVPLKAISYQELIGLARGVGSESEKWASLAEWADRKIAEVVRLKATT